jgi:hypothetical protein
LLCTFGDLQILVTKITLISSNIMWRVFFFFAVQVCFVSVNWLVVMWKLNVSIGTAKMHYISFDVSEVFHHVISVT